MSTSKITKQIPNVGTSISSSERKQQRKLKRYKTFLSKFHDMSKRHVIDLFWFEDISNFNSHGPKKEEEEDDDEEDDMDDMLSLHNSKSSNSSKQKKDNENTEILIKPNSGKTRIDVVFSSRKLKDKDSSPSNVLFRTHQYELRIVPNNNFYEKIGSQKKSGYICELKLYKRKSRDSMKNFINDSYSSQISVQDSPIQRLDLEDPSVILDGDEFHEYSICGDPVVTHSFHEDVYNKCWIINIYWPPESNRISFRGEFCFKLTCFVKTDNDSYRKLFTKVSSPFAIVSKPNVFLKKKTKKGKQKKGSEKVSPIPLKPSFKKMDFSTVHPTFEDNLIVFRNVSRCSHLDLNSDSQKQISTINNSVTNGYKNNDNNISISQQFTFNNTIISNMNNPNTSATNIQHTNRNLNQNVNNMQQIKSSVEQFNQSFIVPSMGSQSFQHLMGMESTRNIITEPSVRFQEINNQAQNQNYDFNVDNLFSTSQLRSEHSNESQEENRNNNNQCLNFSSWNDKASPPLLNFNSQGSINLLSPVFDLGTPKGVIPVQFDGNNSQGFNSDFMFDVQRQLSGFEEPVQRDDSHHMDDLDLNDGDEFFEKNISNFDAIQKRKSMKKKNKTK